MWDSIDRKSISTLFNTLFSLILRSKEENWTKVIDFEKKLWKKILKRLKNHEFPVSAKRLWFQIGYSVSQLKEKSLKSVKLLKRVRNRP